VEDDAVFVLVLDLGGDFAIDDFLEDRLGHGLLQEGTEDRGNDGGQSLNR
jgi:hypothetical protein